MKSNNFSKNHLAELPNYLKLFEGEDVYLYGCQEILKEYKYEIKQYTKKSMMYYYLNGESAVLVDLILKLSVKHPNILEKCFKTVKRFAPRSFKGHKLPKCARGDLAYLIGAIRDGSINRNDYTISISQNHKNWLNYLGNIFSKEFGVNPKIEKFRNYYILKLKSKVLFLFLNKIFEMPTNQDFWETPKIIVKNKELWIPYISGFFDAEDTPPNQKLTEKQIKRRFHFTKIIWIR